MRGVPARPCRALRHQPARALDAAHRRRARTLQVQAYLRPVRTLRGRPFPAGVRASSTSSSSTACRLGRHRLVWGAGYRHGEDEVEDGILIGFRPTERSLSWGNVFVQDEIRLTETLELSVGVKLERNDYTGWEYLPSARLAWKPAGDAAGVGRRVARRASAGAARSRRHRSLGGFVIGGPNFESEVANVFELGYRGRPVDVVTLSITAFLHDWDKLRSGTALPVVIENRIEGPVHGVEAWASWQAMSCVAR